MSPDVMPHIKSLAQQILPKDGTHFRGRNGIERHTAQHDHQSDDLYPSRVASKIIHAILS